MTDRCQDPGHGSWSDDQLFDRCSFRAWAVGRRLVPDDRGPSAAVGLAVDDYLSLVAMGQDPEPVDVMLRERLRDISEDEYSFEELAIKTIELIRLGVDEVLPATGETYATQVEIHWELDGIVRHAHLDRIMADGTIRDWKTSEQRLPQQAARQSTQLTEYAAAFYAEYGEYPRGVALDGLIWANPPHDVKVWNDAAQKPWWDRQEATRTPVEVAGHLESIRRRNIIRGFMGVSGAYLTQGRASRYECSNCPVKPLCPAWVGYDTEKETTDAIPESVQAS